MATIWLDRGERGSRILLHFMVWLVRKLGRPVALPLLFPITAYFLVTSREARLASREFLTRALPRTPTLVDSFRHIHCFATTILDRVLFFATPGDNFEITVTDPDGLLERMERGQGCLLIGAHLGSFDMLRAFTLRRTNLKLKILMHAEHNQMISGTLASLDPEIAKTLHPMRGPGDLLRLREWIGQGYIVALLGDRVTPDDRQIKADFLGAPASFPTSPIQLGAMLDAPVFTFFGLYLGGRHYAAHFDLLAERLQLARPKRAEETARWLQIYADRLGSYARSAPYNWFKFFPFWRA
ncbi:MAG: lipid A biosynthesis acyltransferase [Geminicoccaceae bacterium]